MKKISIDLMLGRKTKCYIRTFTPSNIFIFATSFIGQATKSSPLSPKLRQYRLISESLRDEFNKSNLARWKPGLKMPTVIMITPSKTFVLKNQIAYVYGVINAIIAVGIKYYFSNNRLINSHCFRFYGLKNNITKKKLI